MYLIVICRHAGEVSELQEEIASLKELLHTYEQSIQRKDQVINNLTVGLSRQKERYELLRTFSDWKVKHNDAKREVSGQLELALKALKYFCANHGD